MYSSKYLELLIEELRSCPSIGAKSAQRLALHLLRAPREDALRLAEAIRALRERVGFCSVCGNFTEQDPCLLCTDPQRDAAVVCVVEQPGDVLALERTGTFRGRYHVLGGALSPLDGTHARDTCASASCSSACARPARADARSGRSSSPPIPTSPARRPRSTSHRLLAPLGVKVTRIARGVPMGSDLEYSDQVTLARALEGRREVE